MSKKEKSPVRKIRNRFNRTSSRRRDIALLSAFGLLDFIPISLY